MIKKALRKARAMSSQQWRLLAAAARLALFVEIALRVLRFDVLLARLDAASVRLEPFSVPGGVRLQPDIAPGGVRPLPRSDGVRLQPDPHPSRAACAHAVDLAYRLLRLPRTCLNESLVLFGLLRRHGIDARFRIGVRKEGAQLVAHAWIEGKDTLPKIEVRLKPDTTERTDEPYLTLPIPEP